jgi:hypothetical protein
MPKKPSIQAGKRIWQRVRLARPVQVYELKITLRGSKPPIWRRIGLSSDTHLSELHEVIQVVMGWGNYHLHQFVIRNCQPKPTREELASLDWQARYERLTMCRDRCWSDPRMEVEDTEDESKVRLCELAPAVKSKFIYEYDFGDGWDHTIEVVKIGPPAENVKYPVCLAGKFACPPEDCGGIWGYYEMLEVIKDPKHERYDELSDWLGKKFDPERFNLEAINAGLAELRDGKSSRGRQPY